MVVISKSAVSNKFSRLFTETKFVCLIANSLLLSKGNVTEPECLETT